MFYIMHLYLPQEMRPDPSNFYEYPQEEKEAHHNLIQTCQILSNINKPIYLMPNDILTFYEPDFLMLQLYYLYCTFHSSPMSPVTDQLIFKDHGREVAQETEEEVTVSPHDNDDR